VNYRCVHRQIASSVNYFLSRAFQATILICPTKVALQSGRYGLEVAKVLFCHPHVDLPFFTKVRSVSFRSITKSGWDRGHTHTTTKRGTKGHTRVTHIH
jgi:hypothetical protein